jgi:thiamine biosynthesis lipoprotein
MLDAESEMPSELTVARRAMACEFSVTFPGEMRGAVAAGCAALDEVERLEKLLSAFREDSEISRLNRGGGPVNREVYGLLRWAVRLSDATGGAFDAATGTLVKLWRGGRVPSAEDVAAALSRGGSRHVRFHDGSLEFLRPHIEFNLGAIGKGFAIDSALRRIRARRALMQGGQSSIAAVGEWTVAIGDPPFAQVQLQNQALGTSAATHQFFVERGQTYGHILDPRSGWPARRLLSASAIAPTATEADALSTAFYVMGPEGTRRFCDANPRFGAVLVLSDRRVKVIGSVEVTR